MSDPADKTNDLIAELARLMATPPANGGGATGATRPAPSPAATTPPPNAPAAQSAAPTVRIPGMDMPKPAAPVPPRPPAAGAIRIPGMDNPPPAGAASSAPPSLSKFDFGKPVAPAAPIRQEPLSTLSQRLAPQNPVQRPEPSATPSEPSAPPTAQVRLPGETRPEAESKPSGETSALPAVPSAAPSPLPAKPAPSTAPVSPASRSSSDFRFDFGFGKNPPQPSAAPAEEPEPDPIADLIAAEMLDEPGDEPEASEPEMRAPEPEASKPGPMLPVAGPRPAASAPVVPKPVSVAPRAPESDRFDVAPAIDLDLAEDKPSSRPEPRAPEPPMPASGPVARSTDPSPRAPEPALRPSVQPAAAARDSDPMSEIESLIGEAVRVELASPTPPKTQPAPSPSLGFEPQLSARADSVKAAPVKPEVVRPEIGDSQPSPIVPPLTTQFAPRRTSLKDDPGRSAADEAVLAAAAAMGEDVERIAPDTADETPYRRLKVKPQRGGSSGARQYVGMAVAGTLLLASGLGLYWVLNMGGAGGDASGANAPQLTADATPVKEPPPAADTEAEAARSPVLAQIDGTSAQPGTEQLVSTDQTADTPVTRDVTQVAAADDGGLANRRVRTVTVRPDGTIVSGDDSVAGSEELPVDRPNVPDLPAAETATLLTDDSPLSAPTTSQSDTVALPAIDAATLAPGATAETGTTPAASSGIVPPQPISFPVRSAPSASAFGGTPASSAPATPAASAAPSGGALTPNGQIDLLGGAGTQPVQVAATTPAPVSSSNAPAYVQLSSSPSQADAQSSLSALNGRFGSLFGGRQAEIQSADLGQRGTWYRVKVPAASRAEAQSICASIQASGGDCIVTDN